MDVLLSTDTISPVTTDGNAFIGDSENSRDRALTFHWRAKDERWLNLDLPSPKSGKQEAARASILLEAALALFGGWPGVSYSRRREFFSGQRRYHGNPFTYDNVVPTVDNLSALGLLANSIAPTGIATGIQSTFRATPLLLTAAPADLATDAEHVAHELIRLRDSEKRLVDYRDTERTDRMRRVLTEQNEGVGGIRIDLDAPGIQAINGAIVIGDVSLYPAMRTLYRVFNNGDQSHGWKFGGRMYGGWWQQIPKALRPSLRIDGEPTAEIDHAQLHPRLLYLLTGKTLEGDAYTLPGWERKLCKVAFNVLLNAETYPAAVGAIANKIDAPDAQTQARKLVADIKARHAPVAGFFHSGIGLRLQNIDADMAETTTARLLKKGIVTLPIHDSFVVQERHRGDLNEAMEASFDLVRPFPTFTTSEQRIRPIQFHKRKGAGVPPALPAPVPSLVPVCPLPVPLSAAPSHFGPSVVVDLETQPCVAVQRRPSAVAPVQLDLFGPPAVQPSSLSWHGGVMPADLRGATVFGLRRLGLKHSDLARRAGLSRPQVTNILHGTFGAGPAAAERLKAFVSEMAMAA